MEKKNNQEIEEKEVEEKEKIETIEDRINRKKLLIIFVVSAAISLFVIFSFFSNVILGLSGETNVPVPEYKPKKTIAPKIEEDWKAITEMKINQLENRLKKMEDTSQQILQLLQEQKQERELLKEKIEKEIEERMNVSGNTVVPPPPPPQTQTPVQYNTQGQQSIQQQQKQTPILKEFKPEEKEEQEKEQKVSRKEKKEKSKVVKINLPLGFIKGLTLTGLDAPTFQYGRNNPHPILIVSLSKEILANNKRLNLKECFFLGSGFGEISSERAYIRLIKISCIDKKGNVVEQKVSGWVLDDDGKVGLKGRVVSKQGAVLAKTFMAGLLEGLSRTIAATSTTIQVSPVGTTQTLNPQDATKVALASGFQSAASKLAQFYMKIAEQMYPVVEVSPGRKITILLSGGTQLEKVDGNKLISNPLK